MATKSFSIRIDEAMLDKLHVLADYEGRSANSQVLILIRDVFGAWIGSMQIKSYAGEKSDCIPAQFCGSPENCSLQGQPGGTARMGRCVGSG